MNGFKKIEMKISQNQMYESLGLVESIFYSNTHPTKYYTTVKCVSKEGRARIIHREELFRIISRTKPEVLFIARQKISFLAQRLAFLLKWNNITMLPRYLEHEGLELSLVNPFEESKWKTKSCKKQLVIEKTDNKKVYFRVWI